MNAQLKQIGKVFGVLTTLAASGALMVAMAGYLYLAPLLPSAETYRDVQLETPLRIYTADNLLIAEIGNRRNPVSYEEIPAVVINAIIASEDPRFYSHPGVDLPGLVRGFWGFLRGVNLGGGSTITMQLANNISFDSDNVYLRKFKEIPFSLQIQRELSKAEIIELYLNLIYFGAGADGIGAAAFVYYGKEVGELSLAEAAMMTSLLPCPSPCNPLTNPGRAIERRNIVLNKMFNEGMISRFELDEALLAPITARRHNREIEVSAPFIAEMVRQHLYEQYGEDTYTQGFEVTTTIESKNQIAANNAIVSGLENHYDRRKGYRGPDANYPADLLEPLPVWQQHLAPIPVYGNQHPAIVTAVDERSIQVLRKSGELQRIDWPGLQWARPYINPNNAWPPPQVAADIVTVGDLVRVTERENGWALGQVPALQGSLVSMSPSDGRILALVGGYDFSRSQVNRVLTPRPPGSNFKPFLYGTALQEGYSVASTINDAPITRGNYRPNNYENNFLGPVTLRFAIKESRNVPAVRLYDQLGSEKVLPFAAKFGFQTQNFPHGDLTVALGSQDVQPLEIVTAYSMIANGGYKIEPWFIKDITNLPSGDVLDPRPLTVCESCEANAEASAQFEVAPRVIDERIAYLLNSLLESVIKDGSGRGVDRAFDRNDLRGKTGTTNGPQELWFSGFNRDIATTVFVGFDQPQPLGESEQGASIPVPIWIDYMKVALEGMPENAMKRPEGLVDRLIDKTTGEFASPGDPNAEFEFFRAENAPALEDNLTPIPGVDIEDVEELSTESIF